MSTIQAASSPTKKMKVFEHPGDVVRAEGLSDQDKIKLLQDWETDLREILVAAEEGMTRDHPDDPGVQLRHVRAALDELGAADLSATAPTKAGGPTSAA